MKKTKSSQKEVLLVQHLATPTADSVMDAVVKWLFNDVEDRVFLRDLAKLNYRLEQSGARIDVILTPMSKDDVERTTEPVKEKKKRGRLKKVKSAK